jgi:predicted PolB exonuclease-like 3'-5' exonuclease
MKTAVFDIETIPLQGLPEEMVPAPNMEDVKYGNAKDPIKRQAIEDEYVRKFYEQLDKRMATDPDYCQVVCFVGMECEEGIEAMDLDDIIMNVMTAPNTEDETALIIQAWDWIESMVRREIPLVSYNGIGFDIPVLLRRAMYLDVSVDPKLAAMLMQRQEKNHIHYDLMQILGLRSPFGGRMEVKSLDAWLKRFGMDAKTGNGGEVFGWWSNGEIGRVVEYCANDVERTGNLFNRVAPWLIWRNRNHVSMS